MWIVHNLEKGYISELDVPLHGLEMGHVQYLFWHLNLIEFIIGFTRLNSEHRYFY